MTTKVKFVFSLDSNGGLNPAVRLYVDLDGDQLLDLDKEKVELTPDGLTWTGEARVTAPFLRDVGYELRYISHLGTNWTLEATSGEGDSLKTYVKGTGASDRSPSVIVGYLDGAE